SARSLVSAPRYSHPATSHPRVAESTGYFSPIGLRTRAEPRRFIFIVVEGPSKQKQSRMFFVAYRRDFIIVSDAGRGDGGKLRGHGAGPRSISSRLESVDRRNRQRQVDHRGCARPAFGRAYLGGYGSGRLGTGAYLRHFRD